MARSYTPAEMRLVGEFLAYRFPDCVSFQRVRLGRLPAEVQGRDLAPEELSLLGAWRRWADAVVLDRNRVVVIEAAILPSPGDVSLLEVYLALFPMTPEWREYKDWPRAGMLVYAVEDPLVVALAARRGLVVEYYHPGWIDDYLVTLDPRRRRAPLVSS